MKIHEHDCGLITAYDVKYSDHENAQRNKQLHAKIQISRYAVTILSNSGHDVFFVLDIKDSGKLSNDLSKWSNEYDQAEIKFIPKNTIGNDQILSYIDLQELKSKENEIYNYYEVANITGKMAMTHIAKLDWKDIQV